MLSIYPALSWPWGLTEWACISSKPCPAMPVQRLRSLLVLGSICLVSELGFWMKWENVLRTKTEVACMVLFYSWDFPQDLKGVSISFLKKQMKEHVALLDYHMLKMALWVSKGRRSLRMIGRGGQEKPEKWKHTEGGYENLTQCIVHCVSTISTLWSAEDCL